MRIFVTGGSGFVGGHAIERLAPTHTVLAMARSDRSAAAVEGFGAEAVRCALDTVEAKHLAGVDAVVHAAAYVEEWGTRHDFWRANVDGTTRLLEAARAAGVRRFVHIGTEAALFDGHDLLDVDETHPYPARQRFLYSETKAEAERRVLAANAPDFTTISLRPRLIWGPRDASVLPAILAKAKAGQFMWLDHGRQQTSTCHVHNLARAIERALTAGEGGHAYFIADADRGTLRDFFTPLAQTQGVTLPTKSMPGWLARSLAAVVEGVWRTLRLRKAPPLTRFAASMFSASITVDTTRARTELGYAPAVGWGEGMRALGAERQTNG